jgi:predicted AAA+ superfamily ATPase
MISRHLTTIIETDLLHSPIVALLGPRQCGKTTLAKEIRRRFPDSVYLDLELPSDARRLSEPEWFLREKSKWLIIVDEVQLAPDLFRVLRALVDEDRRPGRFLILGSASPSLLQQGAESLAGRILFRELTPITLAEAASAGIPLLRHWTNGGFAPALLEQDDNYSLAWRRDFVRTYVERDIPSFGQVTGPGFRLFMPLLAHWHGELLNWSKLADGAGISVPTARRYVDLLEQSFIVRLLRPAEANVKKRLIRSPKLYFRDSGILHALLEIGDSDALMGHRMAGASWEGYGIEQICGSAGDWKPSFYRTSAGSEIDLVLERKERRIGIEFKRSLSPTVTRGFWESRKDLSLEQAFVVAPVEEGYPLSADVRVCSIAGMLRILTTYS